MTRNFSGRENGLRLTGNWHLLIVPTRCDHVVEFIIPLFLNCSTHFERHSAHHQELKSCNCSLWFYICLWLPAAAGNHKRTWNQRLQLQLLSSWWWAVCRSKCVEQLRNNGIINCTTWSHLIGYFYMICIMMHDSMNIKSKELVPLYFLRAGFWILPSICLTGF